MILYYHNEGCGEVAFYFKAMPAQNEAIRSSSVVNIDGSSPVPGTRPKCSSCGEFAIVGNRAFFKKIEKMESA